MFRLAPKECEAGEIVVYIYNLNRRFTTVS